MTSAPVIAQSETNAGHYCPPKEEEEEVDKQRYLDAVEVTHFSRPAEDRICHKRTCTPQPQADALALGNRHVFSSRLGSALRT